MRIYSIVTLCFLATACGSDSAQVNLTEIGGTGAKNIHADVWADNWFSLYLGEELLIEDSVSITTERSFNAESFSFAADLPLHLNFVFKDFKENDTGLEYIGARNQQMGDGGFIAQFIDEASGETISFSDASWKCLVIHEAPLDKACEDSENPVAGVGVCGFRSLDEPVDWKRADFDDSAWPNAVVHRASAIAPKGGYDGIEWDSSAQLLWSEDLETDNTLLCRARIR